MHLIALGVNHKTAAVSLREKLAIGHDLLIETLAKIMHSAHIASVVLVSTCNRTEVYLEADSLRAVLSWISRQYNVSLRDLKAHTYLYFDQDAVKHLMRVASGLDSMVVGEAEILGQLKAAYKLSSKHGYVSKSLGRLFQQTFSVAKKVRTQTAIGVNPVSVAYLAVRLAARIFAHIGEQTVLVIGAGDTVRLLLKYLRSAGVKKFIIANRTIARSHTLVNDLQLNTDGLELVELGMVPERLALADIVITATSSPLPIVGKGMVEQAIKLRKHRPMFMIDIAVPRDIEPQVGDIADVYLYGIDDLQAIAIEHQRGRHSATLQADLIIDVEVERFMHCLASQSTIDTIQAFRQSCAEQRDQALIEALRQLDSGKDAKEVLQKFAHVLVNRWLHQPTIQIREASMAGNAEFLSVVRKLFNIGLEKENEVINSR